MYKKGFQVAYTYTDSIQFFKKSLSWKVTKLILSERL